MSAARVTYTVVLVAAVLTAGVQPHVPTLAVLVVVLGLLPRMAAAGRVLRRHRPATPAPLTRRRP